jgi:hypothetical protein
LATSMGDLTMVPSSSSQPTVAHPEPLVLGESVQEALVVQMPQVQEALMPRV